MARATPPAANEFEISIIGPGRGECIVLHIGDNQWCVIDSCIPQGFSQPIAVEYLNSLGNNALAGVLLIVATHWHDDHIRGLASVLKQAPASAKFCCSAALRSEELSTLIATAQSGIEHDTGVEEFASILRLLTESATTRRAQQLAAPSFALASKNLLTRRENGRSFPVSITSLSPSDGTFRMALADIAKLIPNLQQAQRRITPPSPNHLSVVLWVEAGPIRALLGADLEHTGNAGEGWMAVVDCHEARQEQESASLFKVPHHGSVNADYPEMWPKMLKDDPIAVVTPFNGGRVRLPRQTDLDRLAARTTKLYCTSPGAGKEPVRDSVVEKTMRLALTGQSGD